MKYRKYTWIGNQISEDNMSKLYQIKQIKRIPITKLVAIAIKEFIEKTEGGNDV
ncbi:MAG: hypothetical protein AB1480_03810 [Nitrospirota bacterium]